MPGVIKINPAVLRDGRAALAVAWNEGLRLWMEDNRYVPKSKVTDEQRAKLSDTAYATDEDALAKTVLARIATRDESAPGPTPEQLNEVSDLLVAVSDTLADDDPDLETVMLMIQDLTPPVQDLRPEKELQQEEIPQEEIPQEEIPQEEIPQEEIPQEEIPQEEIPQEELPQEEIPQEEIPQEELPQAEQVQTETGDTMPVTEAGAR